MDIPQGHRGGEGELVTNRGDLTEGGMSSMGIVPTLDELEHGMAGFLGRTEGSTIEEFTLQSGEETLTQSVVVAISERSHRRANAGLATTPPEGQRGVLATLSRFGPGAAKSRCTKSGAAWAPGWRTVVRR